VGEPQHVPGEPCDCGPICNWTPTHPVAGTWLEETLARAIHERRRGQCDHNLRHIVLCTTEAEDILATPAGQSLAARVAALEAAVPGDPFYNMGRDAGWRCYMCGVRLASDHHPDCRWLAVRGIDSNKKDVI
jgi:hypothetical protein